jgi:Domain of unknown function (DUF4350)
MLDVGCSLSPMKKHLPLFFLFACAIAFVVGVLELFKLRFEAGDVYPPYSSLRADPLGTMALYESLDKLPGLAPRRDFSASNRLPDGKGTTYLHLAADSFEWRWLDKDLFGEIERFLARGGRLVITLYPETYEYHFRSFDDEDGPNATPGKDSKSKDGKTNSEPAKVKEDKKSSGPEQPATPKRKRKPRTPDEEANFVSLKDRWGTDFDLVDLKQGSNDVYQPAIVTNKTTLALPHTLAWHSGLVLTNLDRAWQIVYARGTNAVVAERRFGAGSVVIATDSYFLSNEALQRDRHADFLAWLVGNNPKIVFDEAHLGVLETGGVATLMRKYHLEGLIVGLALLAGLFIWKNSVSLVPPHAAERPQDYIAGKEAAAGFINLLRRSLSPRTVLDTCFAEWKKSVAQTRKYSAARVQQAEIIYEMDRAAANRDPIGTYQKICDTLKSSGFRVPGSGSDQSNADSQNYL